MKVLCLADIHLRGGHGTEEADALMKVAHLAHEKQVNLVLVNGDIYETISTPEQRLVFRDFLETLTSSIFGIDVVVLRGNHDQAQELSLFDDLYGKVQVSETPERFEVASLQILTIPHFNAGALALQQENLDDLNEKGTDVFSQILDDYFQKVRSHDGPSIVAFHGTVSDAALDNGYIPRQNGIHLNLARLTTLGCPVVGGHYHRCQEVGGPGTNVWYSGSLTRQTYGESEGDKGVLLFEYEDGAWKQPEFISLNPTPMILVEGEFLEIASGTGSYFSWWVDLNGKHLEEISPETFAGAKVRFRYRVRQQYLAAVDLTLIQEKFAFAKELKIEQVVEVSTAVRSEAMVQAETVEDCFRVWGESKGLEEQLLDDALNLYQEITQKNEPADVLQTRQAQLFENKEILAHAV